MTDQTPYVRPDVRNLLDLLAAAGGPAITELSLAEARAVRGTLRHRGWRAKDMKLPVPTKGHVHEVVFPAEVEL